VTSLTKPLDGGNVSNHFGFGKNWKRFLALISEERIVSAERSLTSMLGMDDLEGRSFLDVGSGSGLFSLAAKRLGARVHSFDRDQQSVACTAELKRCYYPDNDKWTIGEGSILDKEYLVSLGTFDIVYSWGVLHHTGSMWQALTNVLSLVSPTGHLFIAIYNDQGRASRTWALIKRTYNQLPRVLRFIILWPVFARLWGPTMVRDLLVGRPLWGWHHYGNPRGMSPWRDVVDWVGGYPFEVATPEAIFEFCGARGFVLRRLKTCGGGLGCNEFAFVRGSEH